MSAPPTSSWSLQRRLRRHLLVALALLWLCAAVAAVAWQRHELDEVLDSALQEITQHLLAMPGDFGGQDFPAHNETVQLQLVDPQGRVLWRTHEAPMQPIASVAGPSRTYTEDGWRVCVQRSSDGQRIAIAAESLDEREEAMAAAAKSLLVPLAVLLPLAAWIVSWLLRRGFASIAPLQEALAQRPAADLRPLDLPSDLPSELAPLAGTVNDLLARLRRLREAERGFAANSAHELRTPLAAARAQAQRLAAELPPGPHGERVQALIRQIDRLHTLSAKLLQLSRIDSGLSLASTPVDLNALGRLVLGEFQRDHSRLRFSPAAAPACAMGDIDALGMALRNLIENALQHAGPQSEVHVVVQVPASIEVWDNGIGVPAAQLDSLRQPFARGESAAPGHGLGLAIAETVATQSGGHLLLASPHAHGSGFSATLVLRSA